MTRRGALRASDQDREGVVQRLHKAATEGRLASEELEERVSLALKARTYDELDRTVADLPGPRHGHAPARRSSGHWALTVVRANPVLLLFAVPLVAVTMAMVLAATIIWAVLMVVVMILSGRTVMPRPPWAFYGRRYHGRGYPRRRPGGDWARF